ncbi:hypothetical protein KUTeg_019380 [Tegillarca granosa]|uniref:C2H2-type domain-containing protein n=1 Tax=Tegillarca granosa TaxID=220873 RepID=A0ABQ9EEG1_TEGGR|nr:hypothetical protein KUTeg_019380 [Tegillarca granosa]
MAQFFETFTVSGMDNQTAVAVQSLLESQPIAEAPQVDEDDVFQCGKCKKQFSSLILFLNHKQSRCMPQRAIQPLQPIISSNVQTATQPNQAQNVFQPVVSRPQQLPVQQVQQTTSLPAYTTIPPSPLTQLTQNMVLTDDLMSFANVDQTLGASTIQLGSAVHPAGPFLSQMTYTTRSPNNVTILSPVNTTTATLQPSSGSAFTSTVSTNQIQVQPAPQQITITALPDKPIAPNVAKPSPTKAGRKSAQASLVTVVSPDDASIMKVKRGKNGNIVLEDKKKLRCQYCDKSFSKNFDLQQHIRAHTGEKPFQCIVCGRAFAQKSNVKKHMATHKVWPAGVGSTLPIQPPPQVVPENAVSSPQPDTSGEVTAAVPTEEAAQTVVVEMPVHDNSENESNENGDKESESDPGKDPSNKRLLKNVRILVDNSYICQYCPAKFKSYFQLKTHMVQHKKEQVYRCVMKNCILTFKDLDMFLEHIKHHESEMTYRCHMCNKFFPSLYELGLHQYTHSLYPNQGPKPGPRHFQCTKCMNKYSTPEALEHHLTTSSHNHPCPHCSCNKEFNRPDKLKSHIITHSGIKPYKCRECGRAFSRKPHLKEHERGHRADFKFKCESCGKGFFRPKLYREHKCQPLKPGQTQIYRPRNRRKVGRPKKRMITITAEILKEANERSDNSKKHGRAQNIGVDDKNISSDIIHENLDHSQLINDVEMAPTSDSLVDQQAADVSKVDQTSSSKPEFYNPVAGTGPEIHTHFIPTNSTSPGLSSSHATLQPITQVLQSHGSSHPSLQPITIIETQPVHLASLPVHVAAVESASAGDALPMQMAAITGSDGLSTHGASGCVNEIVPVQVSVSGVDTDAMVTTHVVVTSSGDQAFEPCTTHLEEDSDGDPVLQGTENFYNAHAEILQSAQTIDSIENQNI